MFITCAGCKTPYACSETETCKPMDQENRLETAASLIWARVYPDRRKWHELEQSTRDEWIRFTAVAKSVLTF